MRGWSGQRSKKNNDNSNTNNNINSNISNNSKNNDNKKAKVRMEGNKKEKNSVCLFIFGIKMAVWAAFDPRLERTTEIVNNFLYCFCLVETRSSY